MSLNLIIRKGFLTMRKIFTRIDVAHYLDEVLLRLDLILDQLRIANNLINVADNEIYVAHNLRISAELEELRRDIYSRYLRLLNVNDYLKDILS